MTKSKLKSSRFYPTSVQLIGSISEIVLFLGGFFLGKQMFTIAIIFLLIRMSNKIIVSELMYRRSIVVVRENIKEDKKTCTEQEVSQ